MYGTLSVSYTHLDVYKRQDLRRMDVRGYAEVATGEAGCWKPGLTLG